MTHKKSTSLKVLETALSHLKQAEKIHNRRGKELNLDRWLHLAVCDIH